MGTGWLVAPAWLQLGIWLHLVGCSFFDLLQLVGLVKFGRPQLLCSSQLAVWLMLVGRLLLVSCNWLIVCNLVVG